MNSRILSGQTWHCRFQPRRHGFAYPMVWLCIDLDELPALDRDVRGFGHNRTCFTSISDADYAGPGDGAIRNKMIELLARQGVSDSMGRIDLITLPKVVGYVFNPVSFFLCHRPDGSLAALVLEVHNTFGETHHYVLQAAADHGPTGTPIRFRFPKAFYVSPFNRVDGDYELRLERAADSFSLQIDLWNNDQLVLSAEMSGCGVPLNTRSMMAAALRLPFMVARVMPRITWQALQLHLLKGAPLFEKPAPSSIATIAASGSSIWHRLREDIVRHLAKRMRIPRLPASVGRSPKESLL